MMEFILFFFVVLVIVLQSRSHSVTTKPIETFTSEQEETIFVSVASYRDNKCLQTINSIFEQAEIPNRVFVGVCQQNKEEDLDCEDPKWKSQIRMIRVPHYDAKGPTWARYLCSTLCNNETYYLQIDSHTLFSKNWDTKLIAMIKLLKKNGVKKPVLSHYPKIHEDFDKDQKEANHHVPTICKSFFNDSKMISFMGAHNIKATPGNPIPTPYMAAGMIFGESSFLKEIPFDPNLPNLFVGEEILHSIRFWTHGWDIFTPTENVVYHYYTRKGEPKFWEDSKHFDDKDATNKVRSILGLKNAKEIAPYLKQNMDMYGLGKQRSLADYFEFAGINVKDATVSRDFCYDKNIHEVFEKYKF